MPGSIIFVALLAFEVALGCAPGGGSGTGSGDLPDYAFTANPVFGVKYAPAVGWTYPANGTAVAGQAATATSATAAAKTAFRTALSDALKKSGVAGTGSYDLNVDDILGQQINVVTSLTDAVAGTGIVSGGTVLETCNAVNAGSATPAAGSTVAPTGCADTVDNILDQSVSIVNGPLLTGAQWRSVARSLQVALLLKNAFLADDIVVTQES
uniref:DUF148 domain-containing protein n=1 Tax=Panagrellus redivivus TaxID=6233 RepID=A0A7E4WB11_PANRE